jgi:hypothetical protein
VVAHSLMFPKRLFSKAQIDTHTHTHTSARNPKIYWHTPGGATLPLLLLNFSLPPYPPLLWRGELREKERSYTSAPKCLWWIYARRLCCLPQRPDWELSNGYLASPSDDPIASAYIRGHSSSPPFQLYTHTATNTAKELD